MHPPGEGTVASTFPSVSGVAPPPRPPRPRCFLCRPVEPVTVGGRFTLPWEYWAGGVHLAVQGLGAQSDGCLPICCPAGWT